MLRTRKRVLANQKKVTSIICEKPEQNSYRLFGTAMGVHCIGVAAMCSRRNVFRTRRRQLSGGTTEGFGKMRTALRRAYAVHPEHTYLWRGLERHRWDVQKLDHGGEGRLCLGVSTRSAPWQGEDGWRARRTAE